MNFTLKIIFALAGCFILLAPTSVAPALSIAEPAKYFRLLTTILIVAVGLASSRVRFGAGSRAMIAFVTLFVAAGLWSDALAWALFNKGMFGFACVSGIVLACSLRTPAEMRSGLRFLGLVSGAAALVAFLVFMADPGQTRTNDRMAVFGINPNMIGHTAVPLSILCMYVAINDRRAIWRGSMIGACCLLGLIIVATGCRGAALTLMIGSACLLAPYARRPGVLLGAIGGLGLIAYIGVEVLGIGGSERLFSEIGKNTRAGPWSYALGAFARSPLIGHGWIHVGSKSVSLLSIYLQTLAEAGIVGAVALLGALAIVASTWLSSLLKLHRMRAPTNLCYLALALLMVELVHGLTESGPFVGTTLASLSLGMSIGLADRVVDLAIADRPRQRQGNTGAIRGLPRRPSAREVLAALEEQESQQRHLPTSRPK